MLDALLMELKFQELMFEKGEMSETAAYRITDFF